ncbi:hypothetical protein [Kitasatospora sp. NPDC088134]|uniref:hypothetical protein n=1 Tax=Kitasatospora sp. NPDC088134 TaxID=3364071 RepID=UPI0038227289
MAFAPDGTAYVTDTYAPVVHRVAPDGTASWWSAGPTTPCSGGFRSTGPGGHPYVLGGRLDLVFTGAPGSEFTLRRVG